LGAKGKKAAGGHPKGKADKKVFRYKTTEKGSDGWEELAGYVRKRTGGRG